MIIILYFLQGDFIGRDALIESQRSIAKRRLVCMVVDGTENVDAEGNESIWYMGKVCFYHSQYV